MRTEKTHPARGERELEREDQPGRFRWLGSGNGGGLVGTHEMTTPQKNKKGAAKKDCLAPPPNNLTRIREGGRWDFLNLDGLDRKSDQGRPCSISHLRTLRTGRGKEGVVKAVWGGITHMPRGKQKKSQEERKEAQRVGFTKGRLHTEEKERLPDHNFGGGETAGGVQHPQGGKDLKPKNETYNLR